MCSSHRWLFQRAPLIKSVALARDPFVRFVAKWEQGDVVSVDRRGRCFLTYKRRLHQTTEIIDHLPPAPVAVHRSSLQLEILRIDSMCCFRDVPSHLPFLIQSSTVDSPGIPTAARLSRQSSLPARSCQGRTWPSR